MQRTIIDFCCSRVCGFVCAIFLVMISFQAIAEHEHKSSLNIAVLYPTVTEQYSYMFEQIIEGITSVTGYRFHTYRFEQENIEDFSSWISTRNIDGYIALGQSTYKLVQSLKTDVPLVTGGMVSAPPGINGISLSGDPELFFRYLQLINPDANRIFYIYSRSNNGWLINKARVASAKYNIEFVPLEVQDVKEATIQYKIVLNSIQPRTDTLWLPLDNVAPLSVLLPEILKTAWIKHITVFSDNIQYARRGVLFALYSDGYQQGRRLVSLLQRRFDRKNAEAELMPSVDLKVAVNVRTAEHLDMRFDKAMLAQFDQIYPDNNN